MSTDVKFDEVVSSLLSSEEFRTIASLIGTSSEETQQWLGLREVMQRVEGLTASDAEVSEIVALSSKDRNVFDMLRLWVVNQRSKGSAIHPLIEAWSTLVFVGSVTRPSTRDLTRSFADFLRNYFIASLVHKAKAHGLRPTRNVASAQNSAADAVVAALADLGTHLSYAKVAKAWTTHHQDWMR